MWILGALYMYINYIHMYVHCICILCGSHEQLMRIIYTSYVDREFIIVYASCVDT